MIPSRSVVLIGSQASVSAVGFNLLQEFGVSVPLVITGAEDRNVDDWRLSLASAARAAGYREGENLLQVHDPHTSDTLQRISAVKPDLIVSLQWRRIIRPALFSLARNGAINLHNAPLPLLRGCDPFAWAIHDGLQVMGVTLHQIDEGVDSGAIFAQRLWPITSRTTAWTLYLESLREAELLMRESLPRIFSGELRSTDQVARYASYHPIGQFRFEDLEIRWDSPATALSAFIRSRIFPPFQLPFFHSGDKRVEIMECQVTRGKGPPGTLISVKPAIIATERGAIQIDKFRYEGAEMLGEALSDLLGIRPGESITTPLALAFTPNQ